MENWEECTAAARGPAAKRHTLHHRMGLYRATEPNWGGPGTCYPDSYGEMTHRAWYAEWLRQMTRPMNGANEPRHDVHEHRHHAGERCRMPRRGRTVWGDSRVPVPRSRPTGQQSVLGDWLELFTDDVLYEMPVRTTQYLSKGAGFESMAFFNDNIQSLRTRIRRLADRHRLGGDSTFANTPLREQSAGQPRNRPGTSSWLPPAS